MNYGKTVKMITPEITTQKTYWLHLRSKGISESLTIKHIKLYAVNFDIELLCIDQRGASVRNPNSIQEISTLKFCVVKRSVNVASYLPFHLCQNLSKTKNRRAFFLFHVN